MPSARIAALSDDATVRAQRASTRCHVGGAGEAFLRSRVASRAVLFAGIGLAVSVMRMGPTTSRLLDPNERPYFLWWTRLTVAEFRQRLREGTTEDRAYWLGALWREANTRDVWVFVTPDEVRALWPHVIRHLGRTRAMWAWLLGCPELPWPPREATDARRV